MQKTLTSTLSFMFLSIISFLALTLGILFFEHLLDEKQKQLKFLCLFSIVILD